MGDLLSKCKYVCSGGRCLKSCMFASVICYGDQWQNVNVPTYHTYGIVPYLDRMTIVIRHQWFHRRDTEDILCTTLVQSLPGTIHIKRMSTGNLHRYIHWSWSYLLLSSSPPSSPFLFSLILSCLYISFCSPLSSEIGDRRRELRLFSFPQQEAFRTPHLISGLFTVVKL